MKMKTSQCKQCPVNIRLKYLSPWTIFHENKRELWTALLANPMLVIIESSMMGMAVMQYKNMHPSMSMCLI